MSNRDLPSGAGRGPRSAVAGLCVVLILAAAGCSSGDGPETPRYITPPSGPCSVADSGAKPPTPSPPVPADPLPEGFVPTSAALCNFGIDIDAERRTRSANPGPSGDIGWQEQSVRRSTGPFDDLVRALRTPPETRHGNVICTLKMTMPVTITLTDAAGRTVTPAIPADACGQPIPVVQQAIATLTWVTVRTEIRPTPSPTR